MFSTILLQHWSVSGTPIQIQSIFFQTKKSQSKKKKKNEVSIQRPFKTKANPTGLQQFQRMPWLNKQRSPFQFLYNQVFQVDQLIPQQISPTFFLLRKSSHICKWAQCQIQIVQNKLIAFHFEKFWQSEFGQPFLIHALYFNGNQLPYALGMVATRMNELPKIFAHLLARPGHHQRQKTSHTTRRVRNIQQVVHHPKWAVQLQTSTRLSSKKEVEKFILSLWFIYLGRV